MQGKQQTQRKSQVAAGICQYFLKKANTIREKQILSMFLPAYHKWNIWVCKSSIPPFPVI